MFRSMLRAFTARTPAQRSKSKTAYRRLTGPEPLEDRWTPAIATTHIDLLPLPDNHLTPGATVTVGHIHADSTNPHGAISTVVMDDVRQGALDFVSVASLYRVSNGSRVLLDSSPVTHSAQGGLLVFNNFGYVPVANGADFEVDVTGKASATPYSVHAEVGPSGALGVAFAGRYLGTFNYSAHPQTGDNHEETRVPNLGGVQRTLYNVETLTDTTVSATDRQKTVFQGYVQSSDSRAFFRCIRFVTNDSSRLDFVSTASVWVEIAPGTWDRLMTVRPNVHGQLIFTIYTVGRTVATGGNGAHIRVTVDANPSMVGTRNVDIGFYFSTFPYSGRWSFAPYELNAPVVPPVVTHGPLSTTALYYQMQPAANQLAMQVNVGIGPNAYFNTLTITAGSGTFTGSTGFRLYRSNSNGIPLNQYPVLGTPTVSADGSTVTITGINWIIDDYSNSFALYVDVANPFQIGSVSANG